MPRSLPECEARKVAIEKILRVISHDHKEIEMSINNSSREGSVPQVEVRSPTISEIGRVEDRLLNVEPGGIFLRQVPEDPFHHILPFETDGNSQSDVANHSRSHRSQHNLILVEE